MHENAIHCDFFDLLMSYSLNPHITLPTRFTETKGTLIDNIFCKLLTPANINCPGISINTFSDHQPCFMLLNAETKKTHTPNLVKFKVITQKTLLNIKTKLMMTNISSNVQSAIVGWNGSHTKPFYIEKGVRQGCILFPCSSALTWSK